MGVLCDFYGFHVCHMYNIAAGSASRAAKS